MKKFVANDTARRKLGLLGVSALAIMLSTPAFAQDAAEGEDDAAAEETSDAIVVTGTRIQSVTPFSSPDPVTVIETEIAAKEGKFDLASTLQSSPIASGSTQITAAISSNFVTAGGPGAQTIDLRALARTVRSSC